MEKSTMFSGLSIIKFVQLQVKACHSMGASLKAPRNCTFPRKRVHVTKQHFVRWKNQRLRLANGTCWMHMSHRIMTPTGNLNWSWILPYICRKTLCMVAVGNPCQGIHVNWNFPSRPHGFSISQNRRVQLCEKTIWVYQYSTESHHWFRMAQFWKEGHARAAASS